MAETLETALTAFATQRSRQIAEVIIELGRDALKDFEPPKERKNLAFHKAWLATVENPRARTWCLETLTTKLPKLSDGKETPYGEVIEALVQRLALLAEAPPDPRIARAMLARFELREPSTNWQDVHDKMVPLVAQHADDGIAEAIGAPGMPEELRGLKLPPPVKLAKQDAARWAIKKAAPKQDLGAMVREIHDAPDDDGPRSVLADYLQELGDPRGEFIALQLREARGEASDDALARAQELVKTHGKDWLGTLRPVIYRAEMRRGFLARIELAGSWASSKWDTYVSDPLLATVEEIDAGQATSDLVAKFIAGPIARANLRAVTIGAKDLLEAVRATPLPRLHTVRCFEWKRGDVAERFTADVLPWIEQTRSITTVGCSLAHVEQFSKQLVARLLHLECRAAFEDGYAVWRKLPKLRSLRCDWSDDLELVRAGSTEFVRYRPTTFFRGDGSELLTLPKTIKRIEVLGNAAFVKRARPVLEKRFEVVHRKLPSGAITGNKK
jgi:uncharacterized protein (TIGR02996 family)